MSRFKAVFRSSPSGEVTAACIADFESGWLPDFVFKGMASAPFPIVPSMAPGPQNASKKGRTKSMATVNYTTPCPPVSSSFTEMLDFLWRYLQNLQERKNILYIFFELFYRIITV